MPLSQAQTKVRKISGVIYLSSKYAKIQLLFMAMKATPKHSSIAIKLGWAISSSSIND